MNLFKPFATWLARRKAKRAHKERYAELERRIIAPTSFEDCLTREEHEEYLMLDWLRDHDWEIHLENIEGIVWKEEGDD